MARPNLFTWSSTIEAPCEEVFRWHAEPGTLERLTPPWEKMDIIQPSPGIHDGDRGILRVHLGPFPLRWAFEHRDYKEGRQFRDVQTSGPFKRWQHTHSFIPEGADACRLEDQIEFELPGGVLGNFFGAGLIHRKLARTFKYRQQITKDVMALRIKSK
jgi:hypothetical protein